MKRKSIYTNKKNGKREFISSYEKRTGGRAFILTATDKRKDNEKVYNSQVAAIKDGWVKK